MPSSRIRWALEKLGLDAAIASVATGRLWTMLAGPVSILLLTTALDPTLQGYYYAFNSVIALQVFLELGFAQCIVQFASHEFAKLRFTPSGEVEGDPVAQSRLLSLIRLSAKWYAVLALLVAAGLLIGGWFFFSAKDQGDAAWQLPWICVVASVCLSFMLLPIWAVLEGCNQMKFTGVLRLVISIAGSLVLWAALLGGAKLFSGAIVSFVSFVIVATTFLIRWRGLWSQASRSQGDVKISWRREIWPLQWRIAVTSISGYLTTQILTSLLFQIQGPVLAGKMGATLQLLIALNTVSVAWTATKAPRFSMLVAQGKTTELNRLFATSMWQSVFVCCCGGAALLACLYFLNGKLAVIDRFLNVQEAALLLVGTLVFQITSAQGAYLRAHKQEPLMWLSVAIGVLTTGGVFVLGRLFGTLGVVTAYAAVQLANLAATTAVWRHCKNRWYGRLVPVDG